MKLRIKPTLTALCAAVLAWGGNQAQAQVNGPVPTIDYNYPHYANTPILTKFMDRLPGLTPAGANNLGQYIPLAARANWVDTNGVAHADQDYYEIALVEYREQMHSQLPQLNNANKTLATTGTRLRGYVQLSTAAVPGKQVPLYYPDGTPIMVNGVQARGVDDPHYLGPLVLATKDRPVRVKFYNLLPVGAAGNMFLPVDTSLQGSGPYEIDNPNGPGTITGTFTQNRATLHLHGGLPGWESDGTVHQWITPAGDPLAANYPKGQSVEDVPDMGVQPNGSMTFYWPNQQSGRLLFYHDHAWGMTAVDVYAGEAAGYLVVDPAGEEDKLAALGVPGTIRTAGADLAHLVPLVIQDKTWVWGVNDNTVNVNGGVDVGPASTGTWAVDPFWAKHAPDSQPGDLWTPHIYVPIQDPLSADGLNPFGRWHYGPYFWPPVNPQLPMPENSHVPESFQDTPTINGTAYPVLNVDATKYRFKILNAAADRFWNLQFYVANRGIVSGFTITAAGSGYVAPIVTITRANGDTTGRGAAATAIADPVTGAITDILMDTVGSGYTLPPNVLIEDAFGNGSGAAATSRLYTQPNEVGMVPFVLPQSMWPAGYGDADNRFGGVPDPRYRGPAMIQIGTEGGILPNATVISNSPINYVWNKGSAIFGNIGEHALYLGPAERADLVVDFSQYAGQTLILYNDAPAPVPANAPQYDYFTCGWDNRDSGGAATTLPGQGPNIRTLMKIVVAGTPSTTPPPQNNYDAAFLTALQAPAVRNQAGTVVSGGVPAIYATVQEAPIAMQPPYAPAFGTVPGTQVNWYAPIQATTLDIIPYGSTTPVPFYLQPKAIAEEMDFIYARMNATLGVEMPFNPTKPVQTTLWMGLIDPATEIFRDSEVQLWKLTHNGVDTHAIHFHCVNVQIINRIDWDNFNRPPDANELGWKDTIKMNPLQDIIFAARAKTPTLPFKMGHSKRMLNPERPTGNLEGFMPFDTLGNPVTTTNVMADFGWEYVWHCHLLGHEEYDMMRPFVVNVAPSAPTTLMAAAVNSTSVGLTWANTAVDPAATGLTLQRRVGTTGGAWVNVTTTLAPTATSYTDTTASPSTTYTYQLRAENAKSFSDWVLSNPVVTPAGGAAPAAPSNLSATLQNVNGTLRIRLQWQDNAGNEQGFLIQRSVNGGAFADLTTVGPRAGTGNNANYNDTPVTPGTSYQYRVRAFNAAGNSAFTTSGTVNVPLGAAAPASLTVVGLVTGTTAQFRLTWPDVANETSYTIQRATNPTFTAGLNVRSVGAGTTTSTYNNLVRGQNYYFRIQAVNGAGASAWVNGTPFPAIVP